MAAFAFVVHPGRPDAMELGIRTAEWLRAEGHKADIADGNERWGVGEIDLAISLGGDGTMLRTVDMSLAARIPVLGVNFGHLGYLTEVEPDQLRLALRRFLLGEYGIEERMTLEVSVTRSGGSRAVMATYAFNDMVLERSGAGHTIRVDVSFSGEPFMSYAADGLVVATPTGSTAYNMSARGPIVSPQLQVMVLTPISPHILFDRSLVLGPSEEIGMRIRGVQQASLSLDGMLQATLEPGEALVCRGSSHRARIVRMAPSHFHSIVKRKFGLGRGLLP